LLQRVHKGISKENLTNTLCCYKSTTHYRCEFEGKNRVDKSGSVTTLIIIKILTDFCFCIAIIHDLKLKFHNLNIDSICTHSPLKRASILICFMVSFSPVSTSNASLMLLMACMTVA